MEKQKLWSRRELLSMLGKTLATLAAAPSLWPFKALADKIGNVRKLKVDFNGVPIEYSPLDHSWNLAIDIEKCIGCGLCAEACKNENHVIEKPFYFRTWVERYIIRKPKKEGAIQGETIVDSPNGGIHGFPDSAVLKDDIQRSFFVPKLCNHCEESPCSQACPVGATFEAPDGVVLVDPNYCIGCAFCIQACPYGCRFLNPLTSTAEKCTLCYHRITRGLQPACVEVCPTDARIFGDLKNLGAKDALQVFLDTKKLQVLKPHLRTHPRVVYSGLDKEVI